MTKTEVQIIKETYQFIYDNLLEVENFDGWPQKILGWLNWILRKNGQTKWLRKIHAEYDEKLPKAYSPKHLPAEGRDND